MILKDRHFRYIGLGAFALLVAGLYSYRLYFPAEPYYDEVYYIKVLQGLISDHVYDYQSTSHPPLWLWLTWGCMSLFGDHPVVWRIVSLLSGLLLIVATYLLAMKVTKDRLVAGIAAFLLALDCVSITQARIGMMNSLALLLMILSLWAFLQYWLDQKWPRGKACFVSGLFLGLAVSTKLTAVSMAFLIYGMLIAKAWGAREERTGLLKDGLLYLVVLPAVLYVLSHFVLLFLPGQSLRELWQMQVFNMQYHLQVAGTQTHRYASAWWGWALLLRPIWYHFVKVQGVVQGIFCIGNPLIFCMIPGTLLALGWDWLRRRGKVSGLILLGFLSQWLFYALGTRVKFFHYIYFSLPFLVIGLAWICRQIWDEGQAGKWLVAGYLLLVAGMFIFWYPLLVGLPIREEFYRLHIWFPSWV